MSVGFYHHSINVIGPNQGFILSRSSKTILPHYLSNRFTFNSGMSSRNIQIHENPLLSSVFQLTDHRSRPIMNPCPCLQPNDGSCSDTIRTISAPEFWPASRTFCYGAWGTDGWWYLWIDNVDSQFEWLGLCNLG